MQVEAERLSGPWPLELCEVIVLEPHSDAKSVGQFVALQNQYDHPEPVRRVHRYLKGDVTE